uniref:3'-5' exonuclease domain-containing protein n=1 Tax=Panagrolaimus superbus TaxID=310955 RepID=A0A914YIY6_9BILA
MEHVYDNCFSQNPKTCGYTFNLLLHIHQPESKSKKLKINSRVKILLNSQENVSKGEEWQKICNFGCEIFENETENVHQKDDIDSASPKLVDDIVAKIHKAVLNHSFDAEYIKEFYVKCPKDLLRVATMELICKIHGLPQTMNDTDECIEEICHGFEVHVNGSDDELAVFNQAIPKKLWKKCITVALSQNPKTCEYAFNLLLHIREPETKKLKASIYSRIKSLFNSQETVSKGEEWIQTFNLDRKILGIKDETKTVRPIITDPIYPRVIDDAVGQIHKDVVNHSFDVECIAESYENCPKNALRLFTMELIIKIHESLSTIKDSDSLFIIQTILLQFQAFLKGKTNDLIKEIRDGFVSDKIWDKCFQIIVYYNLTVCSAAIDLLFHIREPETVERNFLIYDNIRNLLLNKDKFNEGIEWIQIFNLDLEKLKFKKNISLNINENVEVERKETVKIQDDNNDAATSSSQILYSDFPEDYNLITIKTATDFYYFVNEYLIQSKSKPIGIYIEQYEKKAVLLQLSTDEWMCLLEIPELLKKLSPKQWKNFFKTLFGPDFTLVGFAFRNDLEFLCNTFSFFSTLLQECRAKVLCLQKLSNELIKDEKFEKMFLEKPKNGCDLAALTKDILDYDLDKSQRQSNYIYKRPLPQFQKIYAVSDSLLCVLIKDEIEKRLKKEAGYTVAEDLMKKSFVSY